MGQIKVGQENSAPIELYYEDQGSGPAVVLIHGWPLSGASWEKQVAALLAAGHRVITYDRRGFGRSDRPSVGYDSDTLAEDLQKLVTKLDLREFALVGFSMGGGEVARYLGRYGSDRVSKAVFVASVAPFLLKSADNAAGVDEQEFEGIRNALRADRFEFLTGFLDKFYNFDALGGKLVSKEQVHASWIVGAGASAQASLECVSVWLADLRKDAAKIEVPTLILHGDADRILPITATAFPLSKLIRGSRLVVVEGAPHGMTWTHATEVNRELVKFLGQPKAAAAV